MSRQFILLCQLSFLMLFFAPNSSASGEIRRWVDKDGKVHYSDKAAEDTNSEVVTIIDKYAIPIVDQQTPIKYAKEAQNRPIAIASVILDMPRSESSEIRIGRISCGRTPVDLFWDKGVLDLQSPELGNAISNVFSTAGYYTEVAIGSEPTGGSLVLSAKLKNLKLKICPRGVKSKLSKSATFVEVDWTLYDPVLHKTLFETTTRGSHDALHQSYVEDGVLISFAKAMSVSSANLLAKQEFVDLIKPENLAEMKQQFDEPLDVKFRFGDQKQSFQVRANELKDNSVTIKTTNGHGSGVLINTNGYILSNAHVVGKDTQFEVLIGKDKFKAHLIRKEAVRDVALIKINNYNGRQKGVDIARKQPQVGDEIFVIGTPLKIEFQHTVTKGIVSANREISGLSFFQTDAAISPGNSGGPVFDSSGELIALTVAGIFTQGGASLNINYLIPIDDVVSTLKIKDGTKDTSLLGQISETISLVDNTASTSDKVESSISIEDNTTAISNPQNLAETVSDSTKPSPELVEEPKTLLQVLDAWLDKPLVKLF